MPIQWDESLPTDSDYYSGLAKSVRDLKVTLATALANSMNWPGSGGGSVASAGIFNSPGRTYAFLDSAGTGAIAGPAANSLYSNTTGALLIETGLNSVDSGVVFRLFDITSTKTNLLGSSLAVENGVPVKEGVRWAQDGGLTTTGAITFGPSYGVAPVVVAINADGTNLTPIVTAVTTSAASVRVYTYNGTLASSSTVFWTSIGTVVGW